MLIDYRELQREDSATIKGLYAYGFENHYVKYLQSGGHKLKFAYVGPIVMAWEPAMEIAKQSRLPFKFFDNLNDALEWLSVKSTKRMQLTGWGCGGNP